MRTIIFRLMKITVQSYLALYVLVHFLFLTTSKTAYYLTFQHFINFPFGNLSDPREFGLNNVHNFYLNSEKDVKIGIWHYLPKDLSYSYDTDAFNSIEKHFEKYFKVFDNRPVVIYAHGSDRNRASTGRIAICNKLSSLNYHVFSVDYRGYGDSSGSPSEKGVVNDIIVLYNFLRSYQGKLRIYLWGHSLGAAIVAHAARILSEFHVAPPAIVLEAPFLNVSHAATEFIFSQAFYNNEWVISLGNKALEEMDIRFTTNKHIVKIKSKILILHSEDDQFIPHDRAIDLLKIAETQRPKDYPLVELFTLAKEHGIGHSDIYMSLDMLYPVIQKFIQ